MVLLSTALPGVLGVFGVSGVLGVLGVEIGTLTDRGRVRCVSFGTGLRS
jgi:hypothetical protein